MKVFFEKIFSYLQMIGRALMLPVALLPAAGLLLGIGSMLKNPEFIRNFPMLDAAWIQSATNILSSSGDIIFANLPLLFAVGVAIGLSDGDGTAGLASIVGFLIMNMTMGSVSGLTSEIIQGNPMYTEVLGIPTIQTGVFGGIIIGITSSILYKKYKNIQLPQSLGFFAGKRFVPIITAIVSLIIGLLMAWIWPTIQNALFDFSRSMINANQTISAFVFGTVERMLIPFGLHHIWYNPFWYQFGEYASLSGQVVLGDQNIFMAQLRDGVQFTAGTFMTGKFPLMIFGLPAAALAMYHEAYDEKKKLALGLFFSAALTSCLTGITEPIEFMFIFVAPLLFGIHCLLAGLSFVSMQLLNVKIGLTFSGGLIDFILFGVIPNRTPWWLVIVIGMLLAVIYYFLFRIIIRKLDLKTPGREDEEIYISEELKMNIEKSGLAGEILLALGGPKNIKYLEACITRLRIVVNNQKKVDEEKLRKLGATAIMKIGDSIQAIFGPQSDLLRDQIKDLIDGKEIKEVKIKKKPKIVPGKDTNIKIAIPVNGDLMALEDVPDDVFSLKLIGDGFAINPDNDLLYSPVNGKVKSILSTKHAITITDDEGLDIFIHIGIDTIKLRGEGFESFINIGDDVKVGDKLIRFPLEEMKEKVKSPVIPIIFKNLKGKRFAYFVPNTNVKVGELDKVNIHEKL